MSKQFFVFLSLLFIPAAFALHIDIPVNKGEVVLVEIKNTATKLSYSIIDIEFPDKKTKVISHQQLFQTEYLVLEPSRKSTTFRILLPSSAKVKLNPLPPIDELNKFKNYQRQLKSTKSTDIQLLHQSLIDPAGLSLPFELEQNLAHNLIFYYLNKKNIKLLVEVLKNRTIDAEQKIFLHCKALEHTLQPKKVLDEQSVLLIASFGKALISKYIRDGNLETNSKNTYLTRPKFEKSCGNILKILDSIGVQQTTLFDPKWTLLDTAKYVLEFALRQSTQFDESITTARVLTQMWFYYNTIIGGNNKAGQLATQALKIMQNYPEYPDEIAQLIVMQYSIQHRQGRYADIRKNLSYAINILDTLSPYLKETLLFTAGHYYKKIGEYDTARRFFLTSLNTYKKLTLDEEKFACSDGYTNKIDAGKSMAQLGSIERRVSNYKLAMQYAECSIEMLEDTQDPYIFGALLSKSKILLKLNDIQEAKNLALEVIEQTPSRLSNMDALLILLDIELLQDNLKASKIIGRKLAVHLKLTAYVDENQPKPSDDDYPLRKIEAYRLKIKMCALQKNELCMKGYYKAAAKLMKNPQTKLVNPQAWNAARYKLVEQMVNGFLSSTKSELTKASEIFTILEQHYSLELEKNNTFYQRTPEHFETQQNKLFQQWMAAEQVVLESKGAKKADLKLQVDLAKTHYFEEAIPSNTLNFEQLKVSANIENTQIKIKPNQILTRFYIGETHSFVIELTQLKSRIRMLPSKQEITQAVEQFTSASGAINWRLFKNSSLLKKLLPIDLIESNQYQQIIIIPDYMLHRIPFSAINISKATEPYIPLTAKAASYRTPSASAYFFSKTKNMHLPKKSIAIFSAGQRSLNSQATLLTAKRGIYDTFEKLPPLQGVNEEAGYISQSLKGYNVVDGMGVKGTSSFLMSSKARNSNILHIATHGILDPDYPDVIALMTSDINNKTNFGYVTLSELMSKKFNNDLVVVSGCDTMLGKLYNGSGMRSLTRGFLAQGVGAVIGTLWSVPDKSTAKFMKLFYTNLNSTSGNVVNALNKTKLTFAHSTRYKNPKYWAGFVLTTTNKMYDNIPLN